MHETNPDPYALPVKCPKCKYDLRKIDEWRCPECGCLPHWVLADRAERRQWCRRHVGAASFWGLLALLVVVLGFMMYLALTGA